MILYFSATGNCKYAAEALAEATGDRTVALRDLVRAGTMRLSVAEGESLGVVMPSYWGTVPSILTDWLEGATVTFAGGSHYCYFVGTYGAHAGRVCSEAQRAFEPLGVAFDSTYTVRMVDNWNPYFHMTPDFIAEEDAYTEAQLPGVVRSVAARERGVFAEETQSDSTLAEHKATYERLRRTELFAVERDACVGCGLCARLNRPPTIEMQITALPFFNESAVLLLDRKSVV